MCIAVVIWIGRLIGGEALSCSSNPYDTPEREQANIMVTGRSSEPRTTTITTTSGTATVTAPAGTFTTRDTGRTITGTGIPAGTTIATVTTGTVATLSTNATATGTTIATIGTANVGPADAQAYGFTGWSPETDTEAATYTVAAVNALAAPPSRLPDPLTPVEQRGRG